jgi:hypothetical protein
VILTFSWKRKKSGSGGPHPDSDIVGLGARLLRFSIRAELRWSRRKPGRTSIDVCLLSVRLCLGTLFVFHAHLHENSCPSLVCSFPDTGSLSMGFCYQTRQHDSWISDSVLSFRSRFTVSGSYINSAVQEESQVHRPETDLIVLSALSSPDLF